MSQINKPYGATNEDYYKDCERYALELEARVKELEQENLDLRDAIKSKNLAIDHYYGQGEE